MSTPDYLSNSELAARLSSFVNRWNLRENQMIAFISQPSGTVIVTDGLGNDHELSSFPQLQKDVLALMEQLAGGLSDVEAVTAAVAANADRAETAADAAEAAADGMQAIADAAAQSASAAEISETAAAGFAATATEQAGIASGAMEIAADAADIAVTERTAAQTAAVNAGQSALQASEWANKAPDIEIENGQYSARHWAQQAHNAVAGAMHYKGAWDASSGQYPDNPATGHLYVVSAAGTVDGVTYAISDQIVYNGSQWEKIENTQSVTSVAGKTGAVELDADDITTGTLNAARIPALAMDKVNGLQTALDGKAAGAHLHAVADIPALQGALDARAPLLHTHGIADVNELQEELDSKAPQAHSHGWNDISGKPTTFPAQAHSHNWNDISGKPSTFPPQTHDHGWNDISGKPSTFPAQAHSHGWNDISGKPTTFPAQAHSHNWNDISGKPTTFPAQTHSHNWNDISGKPTTFPPAIHNHDYLPLSGGTVTGPIYVNASSHAESRIELMRSGSGRTVRVTSTNVGNVGFYDASSNQWLLRIDSSNNVHFAGSVGNLVQNKGGVSGIQKMTQAAYNALNPKDPNTLYIIT